MSLEKYSDTPIEENGEPLVEPSANEFLLEPAYYNMGHSDSPVIKLRAGVLERLRQVQGSFQGKYRLKIWDAHRPRPVQASIYDKFWAELKDKNPTWDDARLYNEVGKFVSPPYQTERIPPHATGGAVDLTLTDANSMELDMGTHFDSFEENAAPFYFDIFHRDRVAVIANRRILREAMLSVGFTLDGDEWWHFDYGNQMWAMKSGKPFALYGEV